MVFLGGLCCPPDRHCPVGQKTGLTNLIERFNNTLRQLPWKPWIWAAVRLLNMKYALKERIGDPSLFCGRKPQMELLMNWVHQIPKETAKSRALLGRRKCGKSVMMQRLFNILWNQNGLVIPFYFEVQDCRQWLLEFSDIYYRTFMSQFLSFKTRTILDNENRPWNFAVLREMASEINNDNVCKDMDGFRDCLDKEQIGQAMNWAFSAPGVLAGRENVFFLVMIDEIQYMTKYIFRDKDYKVLADRLPGAYHGLVESKVAPMLVSGSYVGWMVQMMREIFVGGRLKYTEIPSQLSFEEGLEAVYRYAVFYEIEVTDESALVINQLTQSDPFYIASLLRSDWRKRDFSTKAGVIKTLDYEVKNRKGELFGTWSEYIYSTIKAVNDRYAKQILLYLSRKREQECTRKEISEHLKGQLSDSELEEKLRILESGDLITQGSSNFRYQGIADDILDLIFRTLYEEEIYETKPDVATELTALVNEAQLKKEILSLKGSLNELKGRMLELVVYRELNQSCRQGKPLSHFRQRFRPVLNTAPFAKMEEMLILCEESRFERVWMNYYLALPQTTVLEIDVLAEGEDAQCCWALVFELKNRDEKKLPSLNEAQRFVTKIKGVKQWLTQNKGTSIKFVCPVYLSVKGFEPSVEAWLHEQGVLTADWESWAGESVSQSEL